MSDYHIRDKIVQFTLCQYCEHWKKSESEEPCCDCLDNPSNVESRRPIHFKDNGSLTKLLKSKGE